MPVSNHSTKTFCAVLPREANVFLCDSVSVAKREKKRKRRSDQGCAYGGRTQVFGQMLFRAFDSMDGRGRVRCKGFVVKGRIKRVAHQRSLSDRENATEDETHRNVNRKIGKLDRKWNF